MIKNKLFVKASKMLIVASMLLSYLSPLTTFAADGDLSVVSTGGLTTLHHPSAFKTASYPNRTAVPAGTFGAKIEPDSQTIHKVYCVDINHGLATNKPHTAHSNIQNKEIIWILNNYYPNTSEPVSLNNTSRKAAAVQLAIWHFSDGIDFSTGGTEADIFNAAREIITAAQTAEVPQVPTTFELSDIPSGYVGESRSTTASLLDQNGLPIEGKMIVFEVTGANPQTSTLTTDANGEATFTYSASNGGLDTITATVNYKIPIGLRWIYKEENQKIIMASEPQDEYLKEDTTTTTWTPAVSGYKYHDLNGDGIWQKEVEPALKDWTIQLSNGEFTTTDENGFYVFPVIGGTYTLTEDFDPAVWTQSEAPTEFTIKEGESLTDQNFGNYQKVSVEACKKEDPNGDGDYSDSESLSWGMTLYQKVEGQYEQVGQTVMTDPDTGCYLWDDLMPGEYKVSENTDEEWTALENSEHEFGMIESGNETQSHTFYNYKNRNIYGYKFEDLNGNREWDKEAESGLNGWTIRLTRKDGGTPNCAKLGNNFCEFNTGDDGTQGHYKFEKLSPGTYIIEEILQNGWRQTFPLTNGGKYEIVLGKSSTGNNFGNQPIGKITLRKLIDGVEDTNWDLDIEKYPGYINGATQEVVAGTYEISEKVEPDYHFENLTCTKNGEPYQYLVREGYFVEVEPGDEVICTFENARDTGNINAYKYNDLNGDGKKQPNEPYMEWGIHVGGQNDVTFANGGYLWTNLPTGNYTVFEDTDPSWTPTTPESIGVNLEYGETEEVYFGNFEKVSITACKEVDTDGDKVGDEPYTEGWEMQLFKNGQSFGEIVLTGEDGCYTWTDLAPGEYSVTESPKDNWYAQGPTSVDFETVQSGEVYSYTFVNSKYGEIHGIKYRDNDGDGNLDADDLLDTLAGWIFDLFKVGKTEKVKDTKSDSNGEFKFTELEVGSSYYVVEHTLDGWKQTVGMQSESDAVTIESGDVVEAQFGNFELGSIQGRKYRDVNGNGDFDADEKSDENRLDGWMITLYDDQWIKLQEMETGDDNTEAGNVGKGQYRFEGLDIGTYYVCETPQTQAGWMQTEPADVNLMYNDSYCHEVSITHSGQRVTGIQFGNFELGKISGYKFEDKNGDGVWDAGELPLKDWIINLSNGDSTQTDVNGYYEFTGLKNGTYTVSEVIPTNDLGRETWTQTLAPEEVTVEVSGENIKDLNFGNFENIDVRVCKYIDEGYDGSIESDPFYLEDGGWEVTLDRTGNGIEGDTRATVNGCFTYLNVGPGNYDVTEGEKEGWVQTYPAESSYNFNAVSGEDTTFNFGNFKPEPLAEVDKESDKEVYEVDEEVTFAIRVYNSGNIEVSGVVTDTLPEGMYYLFSEPAAARVNDNVIEWDVTLAPNEELFITVVAGLNAELTDQLQLTNEVIFDYEDPILGIKKSSTSSDVIEVSVEEELMVLGVAVDPDPEPKGEVLAATGQATTWAMILVGTLLLGLCGTRPILNRKEKK